MDLNPRHLRAFIAVAETGSFHRAAEFIHIGQPALSQAIAGLEDRVGVRLIERTTRALRLTAAGEEFLVDARRVIEANERLLARGGEWAQLRRGRIELLAIPSIAHRLLPALVKRFAQAHPGVRVEVRDHPDPALRERLARGEGDLTILTPTQEIARHPVLPFLRDRFRVLLPAGHPLARLAAIDVSQLAGQRLVLLRRGALLRSYMDGALAGVELTEPALEVDQMATLVGMVEAGLGVAMVPALGCPSPALRSVVNRPMRRGAVSRPIAFALPPGQEPTRAVQAFLASALESVTGATAGLPPGCDRLPVSASRLRRFLATARPAT